MLDGIRKAANNWLGRAVLIVIMGFLILSFAVWGIGDMLRTQGVTSVATVGRIDIPSETFRRSYTSALEDVSQRLRRRLTNEEARAFGLDRQVLSRLISEAALDQQAQSFGLNLSNEEVVRLTMEEAAFKGANGQFDRARFYEVLRQNSLTEAGFFAEQKRSMLRRQIAAGLGSEVPPSQALVDAAYRYVSEERTVSSFTLTPAALGEVPLPDDAQLKEFFEGRKSEFRAPEYRKVVLLSALPAELGIDLTVTDADLRRVYDRALAAGQMGTPAKRQVKQILFPNEADAIAGALRISAGTSFETLLTERNVKPADADLGFKTKREFADPAVADAAFSTDEGQVSKPVKTNFGFALLKVEKIDPGTEVPFETAKANLGEAAKADKLRSDPRIQARLDEIQKKIDDAKIAGKSLTEAAPAAGLKIATVDAVDASGKAKDGTIVTLPGAEETLKAIFQSDIGLDNEAIRLRQGGLVWFEIAGVEPARDRSFEEAKAEALVRFKADDLAKRLSARANELVKRLEGGEAMAAVAASINAEAKDIKVTRQNGGELGATAAAQAFGIAVGKAVSAALPGEAGRVVMLVKESKVSPLDPASALGGQFRKQIGEQVAEDIVAQYIQRVQTSVGTTINQKAFQSAVGGGS